MSLSFSLRGSCCTAWMVIYETIAPRTREGKPFALPMLGFEGGVAGQDSDAVAGAELADQQLGGQRGRDGVYLLRRADAAQTCGAGQGIQHLLGREVSLTLAVWSEVSFA